MTWPATPIRAVLVLALAAAGVTGAALQPAPASQAPASSQASGSAQAPAFRADTTLVEVDTIVRDSSGRFVEGLTASDFEVLEEGQPQVVQAFSVVGSPRAAGAAAPAPPPDAAGTTAARAPAPGPPRVFVLVFDQEHVDAGAFRRLQSAAERFFTDPFREGDVGGVFIGGRMAGNRLTTNRDELLQAVKAAKPGNSTQTSRKLDQLEWPRVSDVEAIRIAMANDREVLAQVVRRALQDDPGAGRLPLDAVIMQKARQMVDDMRPPAARTMSVMKALVGGLAKVPGRKTMVLLTGGFFVEESWADLRQIVGQAARSNVRIYSLDSRGLGRRGGPTDLRAATPMNPEGGPPVDAYDTIEDGPNTLAVDTGGYVIRNTNDFAGALAEVADDTGRYYVLGYAPSAPAAEGTYRRIEVRVKRPGVSVRARRGYLAGPPAAAPAPASERPGAPAAPAVPEAAAGTPAAAAAAVTTAPASAEAPAPVAAPRPAGPASAIPTPAPPTPSLLALRPDAATRVRELAESTPVPWDTQRLASEGWTEYSRGNLEGARQLLSQAAWQPDAAPWVSYALGFAELGLRRAGEAVRAWERVRAAVPDFEAVYLDLADAYVQLDDGGGALEVLRAAERRWPADPDVLNALGTVQVRRGAVNDAIATFEKAVAAQPGDGLAHFNLARTYELRYHQMRRFSRPTARWVDNPADRQKAIEHYEAYLGLGGPYEADARAAIERLRSLQ